MKFFKGGSFGAVATMVGLIVGAGVLGLPYVMAQAGFITGLITMILVTGIMIVASLYIGEIIQRTKGRHHLVGLAEHYLGKKGKIFITVLIFAGIYGSLAVYAIGSGDILAAIFGFGNPMVWSSIFWAVIAAVIYFGLNIMEHVEEFLSPGKLIIMVIIGIALFSQINPSNLLVFKPSQIHIPFAVTLFSLLGIFSLVEMNEELRDKRQFKTAIIWGMIISAVAYLIFSISLVGVMGEATPEVATTGLSSLGQAPFILINLFGLLSLLTAGIVLGFALKDSFKYDFKMRDREAWLWVIIIPFIINLIRPASFISMLGLTATIGGGFLISIMLIIHSKAVSRGKSLPSFTMPKSWWIKSALIAIFVAAAIFEVIKAFF